MAYSVAKVIGNKIAWIFGDFILSQRSNRTHDQPWADHPERDTTGDLQSRVQPLQPHADAEQEFPKLCFLPRSHFQIHGEPNGIPNRVFRADCAV